ncbi:MFS transporter [Pedococcus sp. KACC 23699]|uniref:MFS transporter n=1 Tax=Pedococcus sp. KACC 23699 TaxID=3149228 RepID=A0AAU7JWM6_9MICO
MSSLSGPDDGPEPVVRRARWATAAMFATNGAVFANVVPRYPDIVAALDLDKAAFGTAVAAYGLGAVLAGLVAAALVNRFGSARVAVWGTLAVAANLVLVGAAPSWLLLALALGLAGALDSVTDIAENAQGLRVERLHGRSILNSMHATWSIGAVVGGAMGSAAAGLDVPLVPHLAVAAATAIAVALVARPRLLPGRDPAPGPDPAAATDPAARSGRGRRQLGLVGLLAALAVVGSMAQGIEDLTSTWSALYLREDLGAAAVVGGLGFVALQSLQTVGRLVGDRAVTAWGDRAVARAGAALAAAAMGLALLVGSPGLTVAAFGVVGLGIGTLIPSSLRAADGIVGLPRGLGLSIIGMGFRVTLLASPLAMGVLAQRQGLGAVITVVPVAALVVLVLAGALPGRPRS